MYGMDAPCLNCPDRCVTADFNCHSYCADYLNAIERHKNEGKAEREKAIAVKEYTHEAKLKYLKAVHQHKLRK